MGDELPQLSYAAVLAQSQRSAHNSQAAYRGNLAQAGENLAQEGENLAQAGGNLEGNYVTSYGWDLGDYYRSDIHVPTYEYGTLEVMSVAIPDFMKKEYGELSLTEMAIGGAPVASNVVELSVYLRNLPSDLYDGRPHLLKQRFLRDLITLCYNYTLRKKREEEPVTALFEESAVKIVNGVTTIDPFHKSDDNLGLSLKVVSYRVFGYRADQALPADFPNELAAFLTNIGKCVSDLDFARLYFQPALCSRMETIYFLLDFAVIVDFEQRYRRVLRMAYAGVGERFESVPEYKELKIKLRQAQREREKKADSRRKKQARCSNTQPSSPNNEDKDLDTYYGVFICAKQVCHHFTQYIRANLSLEQAMYAFFTEDKFKSFPLHVYGLLISAGFEFDMLMRM